LREGLIASDAHVATRTFSACRDARHRFQNANLLGYYRESTGVHANPPDTDVLEPGDWVFGLAMDSDGFKLSKSSTVRTDLRGAAILSTAVH
jgi:hypothetical protein